ncbi:Rpn family recombination-promoting nuclease/putative transposase [Brevibacillus fluminis]|uniref:Rpn family recombination-promoting nuclease/putative transposase n=1 Tax=Brevibacillus fluminis TaxID=511487 RepID=UPI003F89236A
MTNDLEIHFLELPKLRQNDVTMGDLLVNWLLFVGAKDERTVEELAKHEPAIRKAKTVLEFLNQNDEARKLYEMCVKALRDEASMMEGAKEEGKMSGKLEVAMNMIATGMSVELIAKLTGFPAAEIEQLMRATDRNSQER